MNTPTDEEIFNHMMPAEEEEECVKCGGETKEVDFGCYITQVCEVCGFAPMPPEET